MIWRDRTGLARILHQPRGQKISATQLHDPDSRSCSSFFRALLLALLLTVVLAASCGKDRVQQLNLLFITLDTTRLDHLQIYGYDRETSPRLEALSKDSVVFNSAFAQETSTAPSHATMFTGQYPFNHGVMANEFRLAPESRHTCRDADRGRISNRWICRRLDHGSSHLRSRSGLSDLRR